MKPGLKSLFYFAYSFAEFGNYSKLVIFLNKYEKNDLIK